MQNSYNFSGDLYNTEALAISTDGGNSWERTGPLGHGLDLQIHPEDPSIVYMGTFAQGLFKSTDGGNNWNRVQAWDGISGLDGTIGITSMETTQDGTLYVAMGSFDESVIYWGTNSGTQSGTGGLYYSTDDGDSFQEVTGSATAISQIWRDPSQPNKIYVAGNLNQVIENSTVTTSDITDFLGTGEDVKVSGDGSVVFYITINGSSRKYYYSTNYGGTWTNITLGLPGSGLRRAESTVTDVVNDQGNFNVYVSSSNSAGNLYGIYMSEDNGATWTNIGPGGSSIFEPYRGQGGYNQVISYIPGKPDQCIIGGIDLYHWEKTPGSSPAFGGWQQVSLWSNPVTSPTYVHADNHEMKWNAAGTFWYGNDGGVGSSFGTPPNGIFYPANRGYNVTQFYHMGFNSEGHVIGGTQDNGTLYNDYTLSSALQFEEVRGGDGFGCEFSHYNPEAMLSTVYYTAISIDCDSHPNNSFFITFLLYFSFAYQRPAS